jgi:hypothetical protein
LLDGTLVLKLDPQKRRVPSHDPDAYRYAGVLRVD